MTSIRILLVESALDEAQFLIDALAEIEESVRNGSWTSFQVTHLESVEDACAVAEANGCDIVLLNPSSPGKTPLQTFETLRAAAPEMPIVVVVDERDEPLAKRMLRDGAQDYLLRHEIDCQPLAKAIANAMERERYLSATKRGAAFERLTGLLNERFFLRAAQRELDLAARAGKPVMLMLAAVENLAEITATAGREQRDLTLLDASAMLHDILDPSALLACLDERQFAALVWEGRPEVCIHALQAGVSDQARPFAFCFGWAISDPGKPLSIESLMQAARRMLCENEQSYPTAEISLSTPPTASVAASRV